MGPVKNQSPHEIMTCQDTLKIKCVKFSMTDTFHTFLPVKNFESHIPVIFGELLYMPLFFIKFLLINV